MPRPMTDVLRAIAGGEFLNELSDSMARLVTTVDETGKTGSLVIEIGVKRAARGGAMSVTGKKKLKLPSDSPAESLMFATPEGNLVTESPNQSKLDLKSVDDKPTHFKEINS